MRTKLNEVGTAEPRRKRNKEASKQALLDAAIEVFAQRGYDAATTKAVAEKAGVSEGLIHRYYESKVGLLLALIRAFQEEEESCALPARATALEEDIARYLRHHLDHAVENADFMRVVVSRAIVD